MAGRDHSFVQRFSDSQHIDLLVNIYKFLLNVFYVVGITLVDHELAHDFRPLISGHYFELENAVELRKVELAGGLDEKTQDHFDRVLFDQRSLPILEDLQCEIH